MKTIITSLFAFASAAALIQAAPADDAVTAAKKLGAAANYSWTITTDFANAQFPAVPSEGVTEKGGYTVITTSFNGDPRQTVRKADRMVIQNRDGDWLTLEEMRRQFAGAGGAAGGGRGGARGGFGMFAAAGGPMDFAKDAANLAAKIKDVNIIDGAIVGMLAPEDATLLLTLGRGGRGSQDGGVPPPAPKNPSGSVTFWVNDGTLLKYAVNVKGTVTTPNGDKR